MARTTIDELKKNRLAAMTADERAAFDETYETTRLALDVGEKVRDAREAAGLSQPSSPREWAQARPPWHASRPAVSAPRSRRSRGWPRRLTSRSQSSCPPRADGTIRSD